MERSQELFHRIIAGAPDSIDQMIENREAEELFLDFKRSSNDGAGRKLSQNDRNNLSKAISGFGNSEGGVLIWGIDCSLDDDGADVAKAIVMLENPVRYSSLLQGAVSGCTVPPHTRVEHHPIELAPNRGVVVTHIPKSLSLPHQAVPKLQYFVRAGSDFVPGPHALLAGMFGRQPQPSVFHHFSLSEAELEQGSMKVSMGLMIHNEGPGIATDLYAICGLGTNPGENCEVRFETPDTQNWTGHTEFRTQLSMISNVGYRIPPSANANPLVIHIKLSPPFNKELRLFGRIGANITRSWEFFIGCSRATLQHQYDRFLRKSNEGGFGENERHEIAEAIVKGHDRPPDDA